MSNTYELQEAFLAFT